MALQDTALRLIKKFGDNRPLVLKQPSTTPADPSKPWAVDPAATSNDKSVPGVIVPISRSLINGTSIREGDETALIAGLSLGSTIPTTADRILDENIEKNVIAVTRIKPGKTDFLWKLQLRAP